jgi:putative endonuclease
MQAYPHKRAHGDEYEQRAVDYLQNLHYRILKRNFTIRSGEIDIIAEQTLGSKIFLVIVEVRKKEAGGWITPEESVDWKKQKRIHTAIQFYLQRYRGRASELRIDLIGFTGDELRHFVDFMPFQKL